MMQLNILVFPNSATIVTVPRVNYLNKIQVMRSGLFRRRRFIGLGDIVFNITILTIDPLKFDPIHQESRLFSNPAIRPETSPHIHRSIIFELTSIANKS
jgi:hypothetical protein